jgi:NAD(P)-dependent dehydrogenase (short-subunit alcohol dehydrogenase family)
MLDTIGLLLPIFAIIALGRAVVWSSLIDEPGIRGINNFTYWIALPALLFGSIAAGKALNLFGIATVYLAGCLAVFGLALLLARIFLHMLLPQAAAFALSATYGSAIYFGMPIDTLINNAGVFIAKPFTEYTETDYLSILGVNVAGFFHITQLAVAEMEKQGSSHVVQITTSLVDHAIAGVPSVLASLTKGGLVAATKSLAIEYAKRGIRVNAVAPGIIKSPMHRVDTYAQLDALHPVGLWAKSPTSLARSFTSSQHPS